MKVKDLIAYLKTLDPELPVGTIGHFGEFYPMDRFDFLVMHTVEETPMKVVNVETPYIGEEPE